MPIVSLQEQSEIIMQIDKLFQFVDSIEDRFECNHFDLSQLDQSILAKAFRGQLVPQDPTDEPASHLLARIRTERQTAAKTTQAKLARKPKHRTP